MTIDFQKIMRLILPRFVRNSLLSLYTAVAQNMQIIFTRFSSWQTQARLMANVTCQNMYIELLLNTQLLNTFASTIYITDGDGLNFDFKINIPQHVTVDTYRLISLLEKYKTYGKRYLIAQSGIIYHVLWENFVEEQVNAISYEFQWTDYVPELQFQKNNITVTYAIVEERMIDILASEPVTSDINVQIRLELDGEPYISIYNVLLLQGSTQKRIYVPGHYGSILTAEIESIVPPYDDLSVYQFSNS